jgi:hypothetical protein
MLAVVIAVSVAIDFQCCDSGVVRVFHAHLTVLDIKEVCVLVLALAGADKIDGNRRLMVHAAQYNATGSQLFALQPLLAIIVPLATTTVAAANNARVE